MSTISATAPARRTGVASAILAGGLTGATCDFIAAMLIYHLDAPTVGRAIARGWYGPAAMRGGWDVALIGALSHYAILLVAAALFVVASLRAPILRRYAWLSGPAFGLGIYIVMHAVVLPLSAAGAANPHGAQFIEELLGHMLVIGLPIALWARALVGRD